MTPVHASNYARYTPVHSFMLSIVKGLAAVAFGLCLLISRTALACSISKISIKNDTLTITLDSAASATAAATAAPAVYQIGAAADVIVHAGAVDWSKTSLVVCPAIAAGAAPAVPALELPILRVRRTRGGADVAPEANGISFVEATAGVVPKAAVLHSQKKEIIAAKIGETWALAEARSTPPLVDNDTKWCTKPDDVETVCIDLFARNRTIVARPDRALLRPNHALSVIVRHSRGAVIRSLLGGEAGYASLDSAGGTAIEDKVLALDGHRPPADVQQPEVSSFLFAARLPGKTSLSIKSYESGQIVLDGEHAESADKEIELELFSERRYWGALRLGFGFAFGKAASDTYELRGTTSMGDGTTTPAKIALASDPKFNTDLVVGFAPYLFDLIACGGRSHTNGAIGEGCNFYIAPYIGFGLAGQSGDTLKALTGLYLGAEVEFAPAFSLALTYAIRRVDSLSEGLAVGTEVGVDAKYITTTTGHGFGLVVNFSPEFLQFARASASPPSTPAKPSD